MDESNFRIDALRHVRFAGRPAISAAPRPQPARPPSPPATHAAARPSRRPGEFISWVFARAGLAAENYRGEPLGRRLSSCLRALHADTEARARQVLEERPDLLPAAISALLIGVTDFFRDAPTFEALGSDVLPKMGALGRPLRVWSAGCSNGAELYSMAILLAKAGLLEVSGKKSFLLGSDCRQDAMEHAQAGLYNAHDLRKVEPSDRRRYFGQVGDCWRPVKPLRRRIQWKVANLCGHIEEGPWDIILWRNMAIYLQAEAAASLWRCLAAELAPQGVLVAGKAERPPTEMALVSVGKYIYRPRPVTGREGGGQGGAAARRDAWIGH
jgi:chemotaxis methyl-accepting protein methylase